MYTMVFLRLSILLHNAYYDIFLQSNQVSLLFFTNLWKQTCGRKTEGKKGAKGNGLFLFALFDGCHGKSIDSSRQKPQKQPKDPPTCSEAEAGCRHQFDISASKRSLYKQGGKKQRKCTGHCP